MVTNAQVALQSAVSHAVALETRDTALLNALAAVGRPASSAVTHRKAVLLVAAEYKAWLDEQDKSGVTLINLDERVRKLEEK